MIDMDLDVASFQSTLANMGAMEKRVNDLRPGWRVVAELLEKHVDANFMTEGDRIGQPWQPLAARTVRAREKRWGHYRKSPGAGVGAAGPILQWRGRLRKSFRRSGRGHVRLVSRSKLTWGSTVPYGKYHQSKEPRTHLPRRPPLEFRDKFQLREVTFQPIRLHVIGAPRGAISAAMQGRTRLGPMARIGS